jgi:bifunctional non-homologous end joining protein LigD
LGKLVEKADPALATVSTRLERKRGRVYIDFLQNGLEKTITAPLSIRALPGAPVSYPLSLKQLGNSRLDPTTFTLRKIPKKADIYNRILHLSRLSQNLEPAFEKMGIK